jgi:hypothetical protein
MWPCSYLLDGSDEDPKTTTNDELNKAEQSRPVQVHNKVDDPLHNSEGEDERLTCALHRGVHAVRDLRVCSGREELRHARCGRRRLLCGLAARDEVQLCALDRVLGRCRRELEAEGDEEE